MGRFSNKVVVITGGAAGIGRTTAERFSAEGAAVLIADRATESGEAAASALRAEGHRAVFVQYDATDVDDAAKVVQAATSEFGGIDIGVVCAGIVGRPTPGFATEPSPHPSFLRFDGGDWTTVLAVNVTGAYVFLQACARSMLDQQRSGSLVAVTSVAAANPTVASNPAYAVSKAALRSLILNMAGQLAPLGIRLNAVGPGITETSMSAGLLTDEARLSAALASVPMGRLATTDEIAKAIVFLASDEAAFITGESLYVDGGFFTG